MSEIPEFLGLQVLQSGRKESINRIDRRGHMTDQG